eukprot:gene14910-biopygen7484
MASQGLPIPWKHQALGIPFVLGPIPARPHSVVKRQCAYFEPARDREGGIRSGLRCVADVGGRGWRARGAPHPCAERARSALGMATSGWRQQREQRRSPSAPPPLALLQGRGSGACAAGQSNALLGISMTQPSSAA